MTIGGGFTIDADVDIEKIRDRIGVGENEKLRSSNRRENYLQKFSRVMTGEQLRLLLHQYRADTTYQTDPPEIKIPMSELPQPVTDHPRKIYDMMVQETITLHELGHVLYTDFPEFYRAIDDVEEEFRPIFKDIFNVLEDGAIEAQLRGEFNVNNELLTLHANLTAESVFGTKISDEQVVYTFHEAATTAFSDMVVYDTNRLAALLDENNNAHIFAKKEDKTLFVDHLDDLREIAAEVLSEPNGGERIRAVEDFFKDIYKDLIEEAEVGGISQAENKDDEFMVEGKPDDFSDDSESMAGKARSGGSEDDDPSEARHLPDKDEVVEALEEDEGGMGSEDDSAEETPGNGAGGDGEADEESPGSYAGNLDDIDDDGSDSGDSVDESIKDEYGEEVKREAEAEAGDMMDDIEQYHEMLQEMGQGASDGQLRDLEIEVPNNEEGYRERWEEARRRARMLSQAFERRLQRKSRSKTKRNQRRGHFDTSSMMRAERGNPRVFTRSVREETKEYSCLIVQDRSGSMSGRPNVASEKGVGALAKALLDVGVDVSIIDLCHYTPRLTLPFGVDIEERVDTLFSDHSGGGTPLSQVIALGRRRLEREGDRYPFMVVVTDDLPANAGQYKDELDKCNFPVIGVSVGIDANQGRQADASQFFHRQVSVDSEQELYRKLQKLAEEVLF